MTKKTKHASFHLDRFSQRDIRLAKQMNDAITDYYWDHYCYFAHQRSQIIEALKHCLVVNCDSFVFSSWQRVVDYKFSLNPLSAKGSILNDPGGRFNIGDINPMKFPRFAALYLAEDRNTAYKEKFGLSEFSQYSGLSAEELILTNNQSISIVSLHGEINQVLDLNNTKILKGFFNLIKDIEIPNNLIKRANKLNIPVRYHVKTLAELKKTLFSKNWRDLPMQYDIPANSQILGQIAHAAGIEAILYKSKMSQANCLAVFPENFVQSDSYIEIHDEVPKEILCDRLDSKNCLKLI